MALLKADFETPFLKSHNTRNSEATKMGSVIGPFKAARMHVAPETCQYPGRSVEIPSSHNHSWRSSLQDYFSGSCNLQTKCFDRWMLLGGWNPAARRQGYITKACTVLERSPQTGEEILFSYLLWDLCFSSEAIHLFLSTWHCVVSPW